VVVVAVNKNAGGVLCGLLASHPGVALRFATSDRWAGQSLSRRLTINGPTGEVVFSHPAHAEALAQGCAVVLLATPAEASLALAPKLLARGVRVIDLSGAFRLRDAALYPAHYQLEHGQPALLAQARYGLPELGRAGIADAHLVANPGCFPTAAALALAPLVRAGLLTADRLIVDACSGVTGAGRKASEDFSFAEVDGDFRAYRVLRHQHAPEIAQALGGAALTFTAHLLPLKRGILATCHARLAPGVGEAQVRDAYSELYASERFVQLLESPEDVTLKAVVGTNRCLLGFRCEGEALVVTSAIDNLLKGAAGQAVQNLNLMLGLSETTGLSALRAHHP